MKRIAKFIKPIGACGVVTVVAMMLAASAHAAGPERISAFTISDSPAVLSPMLSAEIAATAREGIPPGRAREAVEVQSEVERTDLIAKMEAALGDAYGGAWYEPAAAQLHVGVTSSAAQRMAEALAAREGLGGSVTENLVRSSSDELVKTQEQFNLRLTDLFERQEVSTSIAYEDNAVRVNLASSAPADRRDAVEGEASILPVDIDVVQVPPEQTQIVLQAGRCRKFEPKKAYCDPTIVGGMRLEKETKVGCTVGPAVLLKDLTKETTETFVLTAGHCIGKIGEPFWAFSKTGEKREELGKSTAKLSEEAGDKADVGVVKVDNAFWKQAGLIPVVPTIAPWSKEEETEPFAVTGQTAPAAKAKTCISAQTSGFHCGTIKEAKVAVGKLEKVAVVEGTETEEGDSGAPWFSEKEKLVEGTHIGETGAGNPFFQELVFGLEQLKAKIDLELLTTKNEKRPPCPMK
jgi:V8-like Glu-specific endopeptidase